MNFSKLAQDQARRGWNRIRDARTVFAEARYADAVRYAQEGLELSLKALLRAMGIEVPKRHDVGPILQDISRRLPVGIRGKVPALVRLSAELAARRALAMYGDELGGRTASEIFDDRGEAERYLVEAERAVQLVVRALRVQTSAI
ncbi:MAG TPA: HEPN domain-containing protein [Thermoplasmata archaeon]|nr:HEPN domain-containing protein [Thermoplasmata archaeon]